jgi:hypothetical protein
MTAEENIMNNVQLLPLPMPKGDVAEGGIDWTDDEMQAYARACVSSATEALRAEVAKQSAYAKRTHDWNTEMLANNERLAEALREVRVIANQARVAYSGDHSSGTFRAIVAKIDAALEQETTNG